MFIKYFEYNISITLIFSHGDSLLLHLPSEYYNQPFIIYKSVL